MQRDVDLKGTWQKWPALTKLETPAPHRPCHDYEYADEVFLFTVGIFQTTFRIQERIFTEKETYYKSY
jgi:hypothetical protein